MNKNSKIYIAGHRGLVGSAIVKNLEAKGYTNLITKTHEKLDLIDQKAVEEFFESEKPEYVILAAAKVGGIVANNTYRADFIYENLQIQNNVIHQSFVHGVKKLLFLGSTCIYPKNAPQPMPEDSLLTSPLEYTNEPYAIAKIAGIKMCESYNIQYGTNFISVMPTNLYGPNDNFDLEKSHVLPALIRKIHLGKCLEENNWEAIKEDLNNNPIEGINGSSSQEMIIEKLSKYGISLSTINHQPSTNLNKVQIEIWGSGKPRREFLWSEDMADACVFLMENRDFKETFHSRHPESPLPVILSEAKDLSRTSTETLHSLRSLRVTGVCHPEQNHRHPEPSLRHPERSEGSQEIRNTHINIGTGKDISIKELAYLIKDIVGYGGELYFNTSKPDGTMIKLTDPSKLHALGWKHKVELQQGIEKMYSWYLSDDK
jgi:GDP-L-fucose synthase